MASATRVAAAATSTTRRSAPGQHQPAAGRLQVGLQRTVALKVLSPDFGLTGRAVARFKREARTVAELDHPNIVPVYRVGQVGGVLHIAMKFVEGRSLDAIIAAQGALPIPVVVYVLRGVTRAMAYAHERDIVHRDIKAANIMIDRDGRVLVTDFGVALRASDVELTVDGTVIGTPAYMSPEQCAGRRAEPQSDQYSLGIVGFHMLTGDLPFHSDTLAGLMQHHFFTSVPDPRLVRDDVPDALCDVLDRALAKSPEERFETTRAMSAAIEAIPFSEGDRLASERSLQALARGETIGPVASRPMPPLPEAPTSPIPVPRHAKRRGARARTARIAAAAAVLLGVSWWIGRPHPATQLTADVARLADSTPDRGASGESSGRTLLVRPVAPAVTGKLRLLTSPTDAEILIDGRRIGVGSVVDRAVAAGARRLRVQAAGYQTTPSSSSPPTAPCPWGASRCAGGAPGREAIDAGPRARRAHRRSRDGPEQHRRAPAAGAPVLRASGHRAGPAVAAAGGVAELAVRSDRRAARGRL